LPAPDRKKADERRGTGGRSVIEGRLGVAGQ
jgi:hypothetical protein